MGLGDGTKVLPVQSMQVRIHDFEEPGLLLFGHGVNLHDQHLWSLELHQIVQLQP